jgi:hypothetical protein
VEKLGPGKAVGKLLVGVVPFFHQEPSPFRADFQGELGPEALCYLDPSRNRVQVNLQGEGASVEEPEVLGVGVGLEKAAFFLEEERRPFPLLGVAVQAEGAPCGGRQEAVVLLGVQEVVPGLTRC